MGFLELIASGLDKVVGLGPNVLMPIIITLLGIALGAKFGKSLRAGLMVGIGFIGLNLVIGLLGNNLGPAAQAMVNKLGLDLTIIDVGWPAAAAIAFATKVGALIIPIGLAVNILMLLTNTTQTVNIDIWNYWHFAFTGSLVYMFTGSLSTGLIIAALNMIIVMVIGDITAPMFEETNGLPGVSIPHGFTIAYAPIAWVINKIIDVIPGLNKVNLDVEKLQDRFGVFGEPILIGTIIGFIIGIAAGYNVTAILQLGVTMGAVLVLIPKMAGLLMEGLIPVSDAAQEFIQKKFSNRGKLYIGLDSAVAIGHPITLATALILTPLTILLAIILPGNKVIPFADLAVIPFMLVAVVPITKGNGFRTLIVGLVVIASGLLIATNQAVLHTECAIEAGFAMPEGATLISSICDGANPLTWAMQKIAGIGTVGVIILAVIAVGLAVYNRQRILKNAKQES